MVCCCRGSGNKMAISDRNNDLAGSCLVLYCRIGIADRFHRIAIVIQQRNDLSGFDKRCGFFHDLSMMGAAFTGDQRIECKYTGIGSSPKRERRQAMCAPAEDADYMAGIAA